MTEQAWDGIYSSGRQLNRFPFSEIVSFYFHHRTALPQMGARALDVGCGSGVHSDFLAQQGMEVLGIDFSPAAIQAATRAYGSDSVNFRVADFAAFDPANAVFDLVVDRCATTHASVPIATRFYQDLRSALRPGARLFWQGFAWSNSGRALGKDAGDGSWTEFSGGVFAELGRTAFFKESDLARVFAGYDILKLRHLSDKDARTGYDHTSWIAEAEFNGEL